MTAPVPMPRYVSEVWADFMAKRQLPGDKT